VERTKRVEKSQQYSGRHMLEVIRLFKIDSPQLLSPQVRILAVTEYSH